MFALARFNPNGTVDTSFGSGGRTLTVFPKNTYQFAEANAVAIQRDGKIVVAGDATRNANGIGAPNGIDFALARYNPNGTLDTTFDGNGIQTTDFGGVEDRDIAKAVAIQRDRRIVAVGSTRARAGASSDFALARYNP